MDITRADNLNKRISHHQLKREFGFYISEKILQNMLHKGLISPAECQRIKELNIESFLPLLSCIQPKNP